MADSRDERREPVVVKRLFRVVHLAVECHQLRRACDTTSKERNHSHTNENQRIDALPNELRERRKEEQRAFLVFSSVGHALELKFRLTVLPDRPAVAVWHARKASE